LDLKREKAVHSACLEAITSGLINSAHDCSDGGLAVTLAESCFSGYGREAIGAELGWETKLSPMAELFSESSGRIVVSVSPNNLAALIEICARHNVQSAAIGRTAGSSLQIMLNGKQVINESVRTLEQLWRTVFSSLLDETEVESG
jgi:phosphoribosylformylglycinamidine synthase